MAQPQGGHLVTYEVKRMVAVSSAVPLLGAPPAEMKTCPHGQYSSSSHKSPKLDWTQLSTNR